MPLYRGDGRLARAGHRGARRRREMAVRRAAVRRDPAPHAARPAGADAADAEPRHPERGCAVRRSRRQQPLRAQPLPGLRPLGRRLAHHLRAGLVLRPAEPVDHVHDRPKLSHQRNAARSSRKAPAFPDRVSDIVGRTRVRYGRFIDLTHRYRVDKDNLAVRRNEVDLTVGGEETYAQIGYLRLNRDIDETIEDLRDKEELRAAARIKFAKHWSVFGATVLDLTGPGAKTRCPCPTDSSRSGTASASTMKTNALRLASRGGGTMSVSAGSTREAPSRSEYRSRVSAAKPAFSGAGLYANPPNGLNNKGISARVSSIRLLPGARPICSGGTRAGRGNRSSGPECSATERTSRRQHERASPARRTRRFFGQAMPSVVKATAIVNGDVITQTDIDQRLALLAIANEGGIPADQVDALAPAGAPQPDRRDAADPGRQAGRDRRSRDKDIDRTVQRVATGVKMTADQLTEYLQPDGSSIALASPADRRRDGLAAPAAAQRSRIRSASATTR